MATYTYMTNMPGYQDTVNNIVFIRGIAASYSVDQPSLNRFVPGRLDRFIDGVKSNSDLAVTDAVTAQEAYNATREKTTTRVTLVSGTLVVADTSITADSNIFLTSQVPGGTAGWLSISARTPGTSFTILSSSGTDTSEVAYTIYEPV